MQIIDQKNINKQEKNKNKKTKMTIKQNIYKI